MTSTEYLEERERKKKELRFGYHNCPDVPGIYGDGAVISSYLGC